MYFIAAGIHFAGDGNIVVGANLLPDDLAIVDHSHLDLDKRLLIDLSYDSTYRRSA